MISRATARIRVFTSVEHLFVSLTSSNTDVVLPLGLWPSQVFVSSIKSRFHSTDYGFAVWFILIQSSGYLSPLKLTTFTSRRRYWECFWQRRFCSVNPEAMNYSRHFTNLILIDVTALIRQRELPRKRSLCYLKQGWCISYLWQTSSKPTRLDFQKPD